MSERILVTGASGQLGAYLLRELSQQKIAAVGWGHRTCRPMFGIDVRPVDITDPGQVARAFRLDQPTTIIHAAAQPAVADCFRDPDRAFAVNAIGSRNVRTLGVRVVGVSTDLVFDGENAPYDEKAVPSPLSVYGRSKAAGELEVLDSPENAVVRVSLLYGPTLIERDGFFDQQLQALRSGQPIRLFEDEWRAPLDLPSAARGLIAIARSEGNGIFHLAGPERMSRLEMGLRMVRQLHVASSTIVGTTRVSPELPEPRPRDTTLNCSRFAELFPAIERSTLETALCQML